MSAKHTPGPWTRIPQNDGSVIIARQYETGDQMRPKGMRLVAHVFARGNSLREDEANAALIENATDTLEALRSARAWVKHWTDDRVCNLLPTMESLAEAATFIDVAIARTEGGQR